MTKSKSILELNHNNDQDQFNPILSQMKIWNLTLIGIGPIVAQFNPIHSKQTLNKCGGDKTQFRPNNKSCLT